MGIHFRLVLPILTALSTFLAGGPCYSQPSLEFVQDEGNFLNQTDESQIRQLLSGLYRERGYHFRFLSVESLDGISMREFSQQLNAEIGLDSGYQIACYILVTQKEKKLVLRFSPALEWTIPNTESSYIQREIINSFRSGNYGQGIIDAFMKINFLAEQGQWSVRYDTYDALKADLGNAVDQIVRMEVTTVTRRFNEEKITEEQFSDDYFVYLRGSDQRPVKVRFSSYSLEAIKRLLDEGTGIVYGRIVETNPLDINFLGWEAPN